MNGVSAFIDGFEVPLHRALTEPILLGGAPRTVARVTGFDSNGYHLDESLSPLSSSTASSSTSPGEPS